MVNMHAYFEGLNRNPRNTKLHMIDEQLACLWKWSSMSPLKSLEENRFESKFINKITQKLHILQI